MCCTVETLVRIQQDIFFPKEKEIFILDFTEEQIASIRKCVEWYYIQSSNKDIFVIGGYAGTGKSTIVYKTVELLRINHNSVIFCALTGKAALILRMKGLNANTIHKTFYNVTLTPRGVQFRLKKKLDHPTQLIVIDEFSMVDQKLLNDIRSFKIPILGIGDPGQLPPIYGNNEFMRSLNKIDCFLTKIMRQDDSSGILDLAYKARNMIPIQYGKHKDCEVVTNTNFKKNITEYDCVLCWKNATRRNLNKYMRDILKIKETYPVKGDKLLCLRNNYNNSIDYNGVSIFTTNGLILICTEDSFIVEKGEERFLHVVCRPDFVPDGCGEFILKCYPEPFESYNTGEEFYIDPTKDDEGELVHLDFGYALTVHKSQGSEWPNVLVLNEFKGSNIMYSKWLYTAITRAKKSVTILNDD